jgi:hypothetical protein
MNPFATRDGQKKFGNPLRFFGNMKNKVIEAISPPKKKEEDVTTKITLIPTQLRSYQFESSEKVLAAKQRAWQCTDCNTNDPLLIAGGEADGAETDAVIMEMIVKVDASNCRVSTQQLPMLMKGSVPAHKLSEATSDDEPASKAINGNELAADRAHLHSYMVKNDFVDRFMADIGVQWATGEICTSVDADAQSPTSFERGASFGAASDFPGFGLTAKEEKLPLLSDRFVAVAIPDSTQPLNLSYAGGHNFIAMQPISYAAPGFEAGSSQDRGPTAITAVSANVTVSTYGAKAAVRANDLSHIALFCFMLGIICATVMSQLVSYYERWAKERVPRYIAQLERKVVAMLHNGQHSAVKILLSRELPAVVSARGDDHVDTAAFRYFLSKALFALCEHAAAETLLHKVVRCYEGYGEDLYMAHALEDLALAQQHQGGARKLGVALGTMRHALRIYCEEAWAVKSAAIKDGKPVQRRLYVDADRERASGLSTPDSLCLSATHSPLSMRRSSAEATPATSGKRVSPSSPSRRRSETDSSSSHTLMHCYIDSVLNVSADSDGTVMDGLLNTPAKQPLPQSDSNNNNQQAMLGGLPRGRSDSPVLSSGASPISHAASDYREYFSFLSADDPAAADGNTALSAEDRVSGGPTAFVALHPAVHTSTSAQAVTASAEDGGEPEQSAGLSSAEKCGESLHQALEELESLLLEPSLTSTALQQHQQGHHQHHQQQRAVPSCRDSPRAVMVDGAEEDIFGDVFRSYASPERKHPAERGFVQVGDFHTPTVGKSARAGTGVASAVVAVLVYPACPHVARVLQRVAVLLRALARGPEALDYWSAAADVCDQLYGAESAEVCAVQGELQQQRMMAEQGAVVV